MINISILMLYNIVYLFYKNSNLFLITYGLNLKSLLELNMQGVIMRLRSFVTEFF